MWVKGYNSTKEIKRPNALKKFVDIKQKLKSKADQINYKGAQNIKREIEGRDNLQLFHLFYCSFMFTLHIYIHSNILSKLKPSG